jgi:MFS family permease
MVALFSGCILATNLLFFFVFPRRLKTIYRTLHPVSSECKIQKLFTFYKILAQVSLVMASNRQRASDVSGGDSSIPRPEHPDGGHRAWLVVFGAWCAMIPSMGLLNSLAVLQAWLAEHELTEHSESSIGWIFSGYAFFLFFCGAQLGMLGIGCDNRSLANVPVQGPIFDSRDIRWLVVPGSVGIFLSILCMSFSTGTNRNVSFYILIMMGTELNTNAEFYQYFLSFSVLGGISASLLYNPSLSVIGHWFEKRRGLATCVACTAGGVGGVWIPLVILYLAPLIGFGWSLRVIALICGLHGMIACVLLRQRVARNKSAGSSIDFKALADLRYLMVTLGLFFTEFAIFVPITYISSYAVHWNFGYEKAYMLNTLLNVGAVPGRAAPGYLADRFGPVNMMCIITSVCLILTFDLWFTAAGSHSMTTAYVILYGFWSGASVSLAPVCISLICRTEDYGKRTGTAYTLTSFGTLIGIPIAGAIVDASNGSYDGLITFAGCLYAVTLLPYILSRGLIGGWGPTARC